MPEQTWYRYTLPNEKVSFGVAPMPGYKRVCIYAYHHETNVHHILGTFKDREAAVQFAAWLERVLPWKLKEDDTDA